MMRLFSLRKMVALLAVAISLTTFTSPVLAAEKVRFLLDWVIQGPAAVFVNAIDSGLFAAQGLDVSIDRGYGSADAITKLASGTYDVAFGDINSMMEFNLKNPDKPPLIAVMMIYDRPALSILTLDESIKTPKDLEGKKLITSAGEANLRMLPLFAKLAGFDSSKISLLTVQPQLREQLVFKGQGEACTGFYYVSYMNFKAIGADMSKLKAFMYADYGIKVYGNAIITTKVYAEKHPDIIKGFNLAIARSMKQVIASPEAMIASIKKRDATTVEAVELERLNVVNREFIVTPYALKEGFGDIDRARMEQGIAQVTQALELPRTPTVDEVFTSRFLPVRAERMLH